MMTPMASGEHDPNGDWPLGNLVREARKTAGFSLREAARRAGISPTTWESVETGTRRKRGGGGETEPSRPQASNVIAVANVLRLDVNEALRFAGYDPSVSNPGFHPSQPGRPPVSQRAVGDMVARLTPRQRAAVVEIIESMLWPTTEDEAEAADEPVHFVAHEERPRETSPGAVVEHIAHEEPARD